MKIDQSTKEFLEKVKEDQERSLMLNPSMVLYYQGKIDLIEGILIGADVIDEYEDYR